ncbi:hypothetical protein JCM5353_006172 [Sporobolomyces roseus]
MAPSRAKQSTRSPSPSTSDTGDSTDPSSDSASSDTDTDSSNSDGSIASTAKRKQKKRRRKFAASYGRKDDSSTTLIMALAILVIATIAAAAYFYMKRDEAALSSTNEAEGQGVGGSTLATSRGTVTKSTSSQANGSAGTTKPSQASATKSSNGSDSSKDEDDDEGTVSKTDSAKSSSPTEGKPTSPTIKTSNLPISPDATTPAASSNIGSSSGSGGSVKCKKGVGYNKASYTQQLDLCWAYNWDSTGSGLADGVMYIPMLWGEKKLDGWEAAADTGIKGGATHVLGFNEPDLAEQANMSPKKAAELWMSAMEPLAKKNIKLISPAVSNGVKTADGAPMGVPWMMEFLEACSSCTIDAVALHWYDAHIEESHATLSKPIWITEFMGTGSATEQAAFIKSSVEWLEKQDYVEAYAAFGNFCDNPTANFVDCNGTPNDLGKAYSEAS